MKHINIEKRLTVCINVNAIPSNLAPVLAKPKHENVVSC